MKTKLSARQKAAFEGVHACAQTLETQARHLSTAMPTWVMEAAHRSALASLCAACTDTSRRVQFELALLQQELADGQETAAGVLQRLAQLEATIMRELAGFAEFVDQLEAVAETDEQKEIAFTTSMEALGAMLRDFEEAKNATERLRAGSA
jgi:septal ring factor EnvC (AmiA/AmiB activator)